MKLMASCFGNWTTCSECSSCVIAEYCEKRVRNVSEEVYDQSESVVDHLIRRLSTKFDVESKENRGCVVNRFFNKNKVVVAAVIVGEKSYLVLSGKKTLISGMTIGEAGRLVSEV